MYTSNHHHFHPFLGVNIRLGLDQESYTVVEGEETQACLELIEGSFEYPLKFTMSVTGAGSFVDGKYDCYYFYFFLL